MGKITDLFLRIYTEYYKNDDARVQCTIILVDKRMYYIHIMQKRNDNYF